MNFEHTHTMPSYRLLASMLLVACGDNQAAQPDAGGIDMPDAASCDLTREPDSDPAFEAVLLRVEARMRDEAIPGTGIAILDHGTLVHRAALGRREADSCERFTPDTRIRLGRPARTIVSIAALAAIADGTIGLEEPVTTYLPTFHLTNAANDAITVRHLLDHSAGLYIHDFMESCPSQDLVGYWSSIDAAVEFTPGLAIASYDEELSLLGAVLAAADQKPFRDVIAARVFTPLGMTATYDHAAFLAGPHARGGAMHLDPSPCATWEPVTQVYASLDDVTALARFASEGNPSVLPAAQHGLLRDATCAPPCTSGRHHAKEYAAGFGMESLPYDADGARQYFSDGDTFETGAELHFFADGFTTAFVENKGSCTYCFTDLAVGALSAHEFHDVLEPLPVDRWDEYAGSWCDDVSQPERTITITFDGTMLGGQFTGQAGQPAQPVTFTRFGDDSFEIESFGAHDRVRFWRDADGVPQLATGQFGNMGAAFHRCVPPVPFR